MSFEDVGFEVVTPPDPVGEALKNGRAILPPPQPQLCKCGKPIESFCGWHGPLFDQWLCDDCVFQMRAQGQVTTIPRMSTPAEIQDGIDRLERAFRNLAMITRIVAQDPSGANRDIELGLDFRASQIVFARIAEVLMQMVKPCNTMSES